MYLVRILTKDQNGQKDGNPIISCQYQFYFCCLEWVHEEEN